MTDLQREREREIYKPVLKLDFRAHGIMVSLSEFGLSWDVRAEMQERTQERIEKMNRQVVLAGSQIIGPFFTPVGFTNPM